MPYHITSLIPARVMAITMTGKVTADELHAFDAEMSAILQQVEANDAGMLHSIYLLEGLQSLPNASHLIGLRFSHSPKAGWGMVVGLHNPVVRFLIITSANIPGNRIRFQETLAQAVDYLISTDPSVSALKSIDIPQATMQAKRAQPQ